MGTLNGIGGAALRERTCDTIASDISSANIKMRNQRSSPGSLAGSELRTSENSGSFTIPSQIGGSDCLNYVVVDFDVLAFNDDSSTVASLPSSLTFTNSDNEEVQLDTNEPVQIRIPITSSHSDSQFACASWNEETASWERDCTYIGEE